MIHMLIGIPGSGKSTFAKKLQKELKCEIISTDAVRMSAPGIKEDEVWPMVYRQAAIALNSNKDAIFDATNITPKVRKRFIDSVTALGAQVVVGAYYVKEDVKLCHARVKRRNKIDGELYLPPEVVYSYNKNLVTPTLAEGFEFIKVVTDGKVVEEIHR